ncbi:hypothetical protein BVX98_03555, partial [bacterium F11]
AKATGNPRFAWDAYRRFIQMFGDVVFGVGKSKFEHSLDESKKAKGVKADTDLDTNDLKQVVTKFKMIFLEGTGQSFPQDPWVQLKAARDAVFRSWGNERAVTYRRMERIPDDLGTGVNIQAMVFGNMGNDS